jgi:hypothetical protein
MANTPEKKKRQDPITSPKGVFVFPKLTEPDYGTDKYPKPNGEYNVRLKLREDDPATQKFIEKLMPLYEEAMEQAEKDFQELSVQARKKLGSVTQNELYTTVYDKETEEPTGDIEFKFKMTASGEYKKGKNAGEKYFRKPFLFDSFKRPLGKNIQIWGGTLGKVSFTTRPYFIGGSGAAGLSLSLEAVQIIDLVTQGQRTADSYGFEEEEDGFSADSLVDETVEDTSSTNTSTPEPEGEEDF